MAPGKKRPLAGRILVRIRFMVWPLAALAAPAFLFVMRFVPRNALYAFARWAGSWWYAVSAPDRRMGLGNLDHVYGDSLSRREKARICRASFQSIILTQMEYFYHAFRPSGALDDEIVDFEFEEKIRKYLREGKRLLFVTIHIGNWFLLCTRLNRVAPLTLLARGQKKFDKVIMPYHRRHGYNVAIDYDATTDKLASVLKRGETLIVVYDRNVRRTKGVVADFLGKPSYTAYYPVNVALTGGAVVVPAFMVRGKGGFRIIIGEPIEMEKKRSRTAMYKHNVDRILAPVDEVIRRYPDQWFWAHKRWGKPKGEIRRDA